MGGVCASAEAVHATFWWETAKAARPPNSPRTCNMLLCNSLKFQTTYKMLLVNLLASSLACLLARLLLDNRSLRAKVLEGGRTGQLRELRQDRLCVLQAIQASRLLCGRPQALRHLIIILLVQFRRHHRQRNTAHILYQHAGRLCRTRRRAITQAQSC